MSENINVRNVLTLMYSVNMQSNLKLMKLNCNYSIDSNTKVEFLSWNLVLTFQCQKEELPTNG